MNRRHFLVSSGASLALLQLVGCSIFKPKEKKPTDKEYAVFWHPGRFAGAEVLLPLAASHIVFVDAINESYEIIDIPITVHSMIQDEEKPENLFLFSKWSREVAVFNRYTNQVTKQLVRPDHIRVYGHGVWDKERHGIWFTEHDHNDQKGYVVFCDRDLNIKSRIHSGGATPHEVKFGRGNKLLVANSLSVNGFMPSLGIIDPASEKLVKKINIPELEGNGVITHMALSKTDNRIFIGGNKTSDERSVIVHIDNDDKPSLLQVFHLDFMGESFSLVHDDKNDHLLWVNPATGAFYTWDLKAQKMHHVALDNFYNGLLDNGNELLMTSKNRDAFYRKTSDLDRLLSVNPPGPGTWGVHMHALKKKLG